MQVKELQPAPPVSYLVATSIAVISFSYIMRLVVRSSMLRKYRQFVFAHIHEQAGIPESRSLTTRQFIGGAALWLLPFVWQVIVSLLACGISIIPLIFLWRRGFDTGYSIAITLVVLPMDIALIWVFITFLSKTTDMPTDWQTWITSKTRQSRRAGSESSLHLDSTNV
jgi:hypothetical protein